MSTLAGANILITGGASGIGKLLALKAARHSVKNIIIWDVNSKGLDQLRKEASGLDTQLHTYRVDLSIADGIYHAAKLVLEEVGKIDILINNAGIVCGKAFPEQHPNEIQQTLAVNVNGMIHTTRAFLPPMIENKSGHIVIISSAASLMANPGMSVYAGSKWAVSGWAESLRLELQAISQNLKVTTVQTGYIQTGMFAGVKAPLFTPLLQPEAVADSILNAVRRNKKVLRKPLTVKLIPFLKGILPAGVFDFLAGRIFGVYSSMDTFTGRSKSP